MRKDLHKAVREKNGVWGMKDGQRPSVRHEETRFGPGRQQVAQRGGDEVGTQPLRIVGGEEILLGTKIVDR